MKKILVVDDIEENLYLLRVLLEGHGYEVEEAHNGSEALVKALAKLPDLVISDILMPVIDGFTLCRIWKADKILSHKPFIFYTATYTDPRDEKLALDMGADAFIIKPSQPDVFLLRIQTLLENETRLAKPRKPLAPDETIIKNYNEVLIRKLENKMLESEEINRRLEAEIAEKNKIENSLRDSEELYRNMFYQHAAVKIILDPDTGNIVDANRAAVDFYGWSRDRLLNMNIRDINTLSTGEIKAALETVRKEERYHFEFKHRKADGSVRDVEVFSSKIVVKGKDLLHSIVHDITERKQAENALRDSEEQFDKFMNHLPSVVFIKDSESRLIYANTSLKELFGWHDAIGKRTEELLPAGIAAQMVEDDKRVMEKGPVVVHERVIDINGVEHYYETHKFPFYRENGEVMLGGISIDETERRFVEQELQIWKGRYDFLIDASGQVVYDYFIASKEIVWGSSITNVLGYNLEEISGGFAQWIDLLHPGDREATLALLDQAEKACSFWDTQYRLRHRNGNFVWIRDRGYFLPGPDGRAERQLGLLEDISVLKQAEERLKETEQKFRSIFDTSADVIIGAWTDDMRFCISNKKACEMTGYTETELMGMVIADIHPMESTAYATDLFHKLLRREINIAPDVPIKRKDGSVFYTDVTASIITLGGRECLCGVFRDMTERKRADEIKQVRLNLYEYSIDHSVEDLLVRTLDELGNLTESPIGFFHFVDSDQKTLYLQAWSTRTAAEYCKAEGLGLHYSIDRAGVWVDCVRERKTVIHNDYSSLPHRKGLPEGHAPLVRELVVPIMRLDRIVAILGIGNKPVDYNDQDIETVSMFADVAWNITERKQAEDRLQQLYDDLEQIVAMRTSDLELMNTELESFSYTVSHDLRAPLRRINAFLEMFRREIGDNLSEKADHYISVIEDSGKRMETLITDLLSFSRTGRAELSMKPVEIAIIVGEVLDEFVEEITLRSISVVRKPLPKVIGDRAMINIVYMNLIGNAIKFTSKTAAPEIVIGCDIRNGEAVFFVRDNGVGFDMDYVDKLFGVFQRLHAESDFEGTGIGLATVKRIIQRLGGRVWATGKPGEGACIYFTLLMEDNSH